jgi:hypothetical protein
VLRACAGGIEFLPSFLLAFFRLVFWKNNQVGFLELRNPNARPPSSLFLPTCFYPQTGIMSCRPVLESDPGHMGGRHRLLPSHFGSHHRLALPRPDIYSWPAQPCYQCRWMDLTRNRLCTLRVRAASMSHALACRRQAACFTDHASPAFRCELELGYTHPAKQSRNAMP